MARCPAAATAGYPAEESLYEEGDEPALAIEKQKASTPTSGEHCRQRNQTTHDTAGPKVVGEKRNAKRYPDRSGEHDRRERNQRLPQSACASFRRSRNWRTKPTVHHPRRENPPQDEHQRVHDQPEQEHQQPHSREPRLPPITDRPKKEVDAPPIGGRHDSHPIAGPDRTGGR